MGHVFFYTESDGGLDRTARDSGGGRCNNGFKRLLDRRIGARNKVIRIMYRQMSVQLGIIFDTNNAG